MPDTSVPHIAPLPAASAATASSVTASATVAEALVSGSHSSGNLLLPQGLGPVLGQPQADPNAQRQQLEALARQQQVLLAALARQPLSLEWQQGQLSLQPLNQLLPAIALPRTQGEWLLPLLDPPAAPAPTLATTYRRPQALPELWPADAATPPRDRSPAVMANWRGPPQPCYRGGCWPRCCCAGSPLAQPPPVSRQSQHRPKACCSLPVVRR